MVKPNKKKILVFSFFIFLTFNFLISCVSASKCKINTAQIRGYLENNANWNGAYELLSIYENCNASKNSFDRGMAKFILKTLEEVFLHRGEPTLVRKKAAFILARSKEQEAIRILTIILKSKDDIEIRKSIAIDSKILLENSRETFLPVIFKVIENAKENTEIREMLISTVVENLEREQFEQSFLKIIKNKFDNAHIRKRVAVVAFLNKPSKNAIHALQDILNDKEDKGDVRMMAAYLLHYNGFLHDESFAQYMIDIWRNSRDSMERYKVLLFSRVVDFKKFTDKCKEDIAKKVANIINSFTTKERDSLISFYKDAATLINKLHDSDDQRDLIRTKIVQNLDLRAKYYLIALGGDQLYTSSFFKLYEDFGKEKIVPKLKSLDPNGEYHSKFILTLASFGVSEKVVQEDPEFFLRVVEEILKDKSDLVKNGALLASPVSVVLENTNGQFENASSKMQELLLKLYEEYKRKKDKDGAAVLGYFIKLNKKFFKKEYEKRVNEICDSLPEILEPRVPDEWLKDNKITAKLYFYPDENSFEIARNYFANQIGIKSIYTFGRNIILKLDPDNKITLKKESIRNGVNLKIDGNTVKISLGHAEKAELEVSDSKGFGITFFQDESTIIKKKINKLYVEIILTKNNKDVLQSLKNGSLDIIAHRGHSYHLEKTFPKERINCSKKLLYLGSCGSFRDIPDLEKFYSNCYYIADEDVGIGMDNNRVLDSILRSIANGERDWKKIKEITEKEVRAYGVTGIVYPIDKGMLYHSFIKQAKQKLESTGK